MHQNLKVEAGIHYFKENLQIYLNHLKILKNKIYKLKAKITT